MHPLLLFAICTTIWGTTWIAITFQTPATAPEIAVALRFTIAALLVFGWCALRRIALPRRVAEHLWQFALGALGFCLTYFLVYHAERFIVSGLIAVGYSATPLLNMLLSRLFLGTPMSRRIALGGALGLLGIVLIFWPEIRAARSGSPLAIGATLAAGAVLASALANIIVVRNQTIGLRGWAPLGLAMGYGALLAWLYVLLGGVSVAVRWSPAFALSLAYLAIFGSVVAFGAYYALVGRIGAARAGYVGVSATVVALIVSTFAEGYHWTWVTAAGVAAAFAGNVLALQPPRGKIPWRPVARSSQAD